MQYNNGSSHETKAWFKVPLLKWPLFFVKASIHVKARGGGRLFSYLWRHALI